MKYRGNLDGPKTRKEWEARRAHASAVGVRRIAANPKVRQKFAAAMRSHGFLSLKSWSRFVSVVREDVNNEVLSEDTRKRLRVYRKDDPGRPLE